MTEVIRQKTKEVAMNQNAIYGLVVLIFLTVAFYIYFAGTAVHTLTILEKTKEQMQSLSVKVSELESDHLVMQNNINTEKATILGFVEVNNPTFIIKGGTKASLSLKTD